MSYLLDTNVISETVKSDPNKNVMAWLKSVPSNSLFISVLTLGEIRRGVERLTDGKRKRDLLLWLENDVPHWFSDHILNIDRSVADRWGFITSHLSAGPASSAIDTLIAATAMAHNLKMVTRNTKDFCVPGLELINPFE
jgi:toxin FitB